MSKMKQRPSSALVDQLCAELGELDTKATMPPGPYSISMTKLPGGGLSIPFTVVCGDGRAVCGHVPSAAIAGEIAMALNTIEQLAKVSGLGKPNWTSR